MKHHQQNLDTIVRSKPTDTYINKTIETDFNSTLLDDGIFFASHTDNTLIDHGQNTTRSNNTTTANETTNSTIIYRNQQHRQPVNSNELSQNSDPLITTISTLPNVNTPLPSFQGQNFVHFNIEPVILNNSVQSILANNQNIQITPQ